MKKFLAAILAVMLLLGCVSAVAETKIDVKTINAYTLRMNEKTGTLYGRVDRKQGYTVFDLEGNALNGEGYINMSYEGYGFEVEVEGEGLNRKGLLDSQGQVVIPAEYGDVDSISEKWAAGIKLVEATSDNYDYKIYVSGGDNKFALVDTVDFFFNGVKVGTLNRSQYKYTGVHGDYLYVSDREGTYHHYAPDFTPSTHESGYSSEYDHDYKAKTTWHSGSGQAAFNPSCTLTADEVEVSVREEKGRLYDLQGNVIADTSAYYSVYSFDGGYARTRSRDEKYGMINSKGEEVLACLYDDVDYKGFRCGYISVVKDGKQGFVSANGTENAFIYPEAAVKVQTPFAFVQQLDGSISVISAAVGELPTRYVEYKSLWGEGAPFAILQDAAGNVGVIGLAGEVLIPFDGSYDGLYDLEVSDDGKTILGDDGRVYLIDYDYSALAAPAAEPAGISIDIPVVTLPTVGGEPEPAAAESWTCPSCGKENANDANFCPNDGSKRPEVPTEWTCPSCGKVNAADANFCPQDGTAKQ